MAETLTGITLNIQFSGSDLFVAGSLSLTGVTTPATLVSQSVSVVGPAVAGSSAVLLVSAQAPFQLPAATAVLTVSSGLTVASTYTSKMGDFVSSSYPAQFNGKVGLLFGTMPVSISERSIYRALSDLSRCSIRMPQEPPMPPEA